MLEKDERLSFSKLIKSPFTVQFKTISELINSKNARQILFHIKQNSTMIPVCKCGNKLGWHPDLREYRKFCSKACTAKFTCENKKENNLKKYGKEWHSQLDSWSEKVKDTSFKKYGVEHYSKSNQFKSKIIESNIIKYNVPHVMQVDAIKSKVKETNLLKYGFENPFQNELIQNKFKETNLLKYGFENPMCNPAIRIKAVETARNNYYSPDVLEKITNKEWLSTEHIDGKSISEIADIIGVSASNLAKIFNKLDIDVIRHQRSVLEKKIFDYYSCYFSDIQHNDRNIIYPSELDIIIPSKKIAIEINGCYFHSEKFKSNKNYHLDKTVKCNGNGFELLQFWDMELSNNFDKITSFINSKLGIGGRIYARNTTIKLISAAEKRDFINQYHLQNDVNSSINIGLFYNEELIMVTTFGKPRFTKSENTFELLRLCSASGITVVGGASKLIKYFIQHFMKTNDTLISYCDRRYSTGNVYKNSGFSLISISPPGFFYIDSAGKYAGSRYQWQKHLLSSKLQNFDPALTAFQNMKNNGYEKVWDCGQLVFSLTK